jgi:hypothetical protein
MHKNNKNTILLGSVGIDGRLFSEENVSQHQPAVHHESKTKPYYSLEWQCHMGGRTFVIHHTEILN